MDDVKNADQAASGSRPAISSSITSCPVHLEESLFCLTVRFSADHITTASLIGKISRLLQKAGVSNASISGSSRAEDSRRTGMVPTADE